MPLASARYQRHTLIPGFSQERLAQAQVLVVGAGAIGNEVVKNLALLGVGHICLVDFDMAEEHNLPRSVLLRDTDIGKSKAQAVAQHAQDLAPSLQISANNGDVRDLIGLSQLAKFDVAIAAVDNIEARLWLNSLCWLAKKPMVNAAIDHRFITVERYPFHLTSTQTACYECHLPESVYARLAERYSCGGLARAAQQQRTVATTTITASLAGAHAAWQALSMIGALKGELDERLSVRSFSDSYLGHAHTTALGFNSQCLACADTRHRALERIRVGSKKSVTASELLQALTRGQAAKQTTELGLLLSEPIIASASCLQCEHHRSEVLGNAARRFDEHLIICTQCQYSAVQVELAQTLTGEQIKAMAGENLSVQVSFAKLIDAQGNCLQLLDFSGESG